MHRPNLGDRMLGVGVDYVGQIFAVDVTLEAEHFAHVCLSIFPVVMPQPDYIILEVRVWS